ncbi:MAG: trypsin-like serine protease [Roseateles sp.]|nr:MAG: trypsin-like serine protease [Roseateles sp.]
MKPALKLAALAAALMLGQAAHAANAQLSADLVAGMEPNTGNTSSPSNWRFAPGQVFNGVAGALDGVARLSFTNADGGFACSGSLLAGGQYVLTAGHCADDFTSMTVQFGWYNGTAQVTRSVSVSDVYLNPKWDGTLDTGADIALIKLNAPVTNIKGYQISTTNDVGKQVLVAGYGTTSVGSSDSATSWADGNYGHYAYNTYDVLSSTFNRDIGTRTINGDQWVYDPSFYVAGTYMSDFDAPGDANYNSLGRIASQYGGTWTSDAGLGANEGLIAGGDSGGGDFVFVNGQWVVSGVHSWGWNNACGYFGLTSCAGLNGNKASYGDLSGSTATFSHADWIASIAGTQVVAVPEPQTYALLLAGLAVVGSLARRRRSV